MDWRTRICGASCDNKMPLLRAAALPDTWASFIAVICHYFTDVSEKVSYGPPLFGTSGPHFAVNYFLAVMENRRAQKQVNLNG
jgi:hypothetical protein